jgi:hypothetical protein
MAMVEQVRFGQAIAIAFKSAGRPSGAHRKMISIRRPWSRSVSS